MPALIIKDVLQNAPVDSSQALIEDAAVLFKRSSEGDI